MSCIQTRLSYLVSQALATSVRRSTDGRLRRPRLLVGLDIALFRQVCLVGKGRLGRYTTTYIHDTLGIAGGNPRLPYVQNQDLSGPCAHWLTKVLAKIPTRTGYLELALLPACPLLYLLPQ